VSGDGNDTFSGEEGNDTLVLDLGTFDSDNLQDAYDSGDFEIQLTDEDGNEVAITDDMWDENGNLSLPDGFSGSIVGPVPDYSTITFDGVETIDGAF
jgi:hypothetical protein